MMQLGILGSTRGTHLSVIANAIENKLLPAKINLVISNKINAGILDRATAHRLPSLFVDATDLSRDQYDEKISTSLKQHRVDFIILIGYMRILSTKFVTEWKNKIINVHPSLLPAHAGKMDLEVHRAVLVAKEKETGCTVHYVTETVDSGPIILQKRCSVLPNDTPEILKERVQQLEGQALIEAMQHFIAA